MKTKVIFCENCTQGWVYKTDLAWYPQCWCCGRSWKWQLEESQAGEWDYSWHWPAKQSKASKRRSAQRAAEHQAASQFLSSQRTGDGDCLSIKRETNTKMQSRPCGNTRNLMHKDCCGRQGFPLRVDRMRSPLPNNSARAFKNTRRTPCAHIQEDPVTS